MHRARFGCQRPLTHYAATILRSYPTATARPRDVSVNWDRATLSGLWFPIPRKRTSAPNRRSTFTTSTYNTRRSLERSSITYPHPKVFGKRPTARRTLIPTNIPLAGGNGCGKKVLDQRDIEGIGD